MWRRVPQVRTVQITLLVLVNQFPPMPTGRRSVYYQLALQEAVYGIVFPRILDAFKRNRLSGVRYVII